MVEFRAEQLHSLLKYAPRYELAAALRILLASGFEWHSIRFEGIRELHAPRGEVIRRIRIETAPATVAIVSLNAGLLSVGSPLPEYFKEFASRLPSPDAFINFLGFWDSLQLSGLAFATWPQLSAGRRGLLGKTFRARLQLTSRTGLHWVFRTLFPELPVRILPAVFSRRGRGQRARLGGTLDGRLVIGSEFMDRCPGFRVRLCAEEMHNDCGVEWETEAKTRLARIASMLNAAAKPIEVVMHFERYLHGQRLVGKNDPRAQLGVRPWLLSDPKSDIGPGEVVLRQAWG